MPENKKPFILQIPSELGAGTRGAGLGPEAVRLADYSLGTGIFARNPFKILPYSNDALFNEIKHFLKTGEHLEKPTMQERLNAVKQHIDFAVRWKGEMVGLLEMRSHYGNYFKGTANFRDYRSQLVRKNTLEEINEVLYNIEQEFLVQ